MVDGKKYLKARKSHKPMNILNDYSVDGYINDANTSLPKVMGSTRINDSQDTNVLNGYGNLASEGYKKTIRRDKSATKSQKELIHKSYDLGEMKMTR